MHRLRYCFLAVPCLCLATLAAVGAPALNPIKTFGFPDASAGLPCSPAICASDGFLYLTTPQGGAFGSGSLLRLARDGSGFGIIASFGGSSNWPAHPYAAVIEGTDGLLYGTTEDGGIYGFGTVFRVNKDGTGFETLKSFTGADGAYPEADLAEGADGLLYGTTTGGGTNDQGVVFSLSKTGSNYTPLVVFDGTNGANPSASLLVSSDGTLFGTTYSGGKSNLGTLFRVGTSGQGLQVLRHFSGATTNGSKPLGRLVMNSDGNLFGTTSAGGTNGTGTIYRIQPDGNAFTILRHFGKTTTTTDGRTPLSRLLLGSDNLLYGTTSDGGTNASGTVFRIGTDGSGYQVLSHLGQPRKPTEGLVEGPDGVLYGASESGGDGGDGTVFSIQKDGSSLTVLRSLLRAGGDGAQPAAGVIQTLDGALCGTTKLGGLAGGGGIFRMGGNFQTYGFLQSLDWNTTYGPGGGVVEGPGGLLYGAGQYGGPFNFGGIFALDPAGSGFNWIYSPNGGTNGQEPRASLLLGTDGVLYGTTVLGGNKGHGSVFRLGADNSDYRILVHFASGFGTGAATSPGANPVQPLIEGSDGMLYGTAYSGGQSNNGVVFQLGKDGANYKVLKAFGNPKADGANPMSPVLEASDGLLYGTTYSGGTSNNAGAVYRLSKSGTGFQMLYAFAGAALDGRHPSGRLVEGGDGAIYGTTEYGGASGKGTVYRLNKDGTGYTLLASFGSAAGEYPRGGLILGPGGNFYGTAEKGGLSTLGTVFALSFPPEERIEHAELSAAFKLACTGIPGTLYYLERASRLASPADWAEIRQTNAPAEGKFEMTDPAPPPGGAFYRLRR